MYFIAFLAGLACKLYDDLSDNVLLASFRNPALMEFLKGIHYILFTTLSLHNPVFFMLFYLICSVNSLADPNAWSGSYESGFLYAASLIYLLVQYEQLPQINVMDVCIITVMLFIFAVESSVVQQHTEFSIWKLIARSFGVCGLLCMIVLPIFTAPLKYIFAYGIGYCLCSVFVQYYSLITYRNRKPEPRKRKSKVKRLRSS